MVLTLYCFCLYSKSEKVHCWNWMCSVQHKIGCFIQFMILIWFLGISIFQLLHAWYMVNWQLIYLLLQVIIYIYIFIYLSSLHVWYWEIFLNSEHAARVFWNLFPRNILWKWSWNLVGINFSMRCHFTWRVLDLFHFIPFIYVALYACWIPPSYAMVLSPTDNRLFFVSLTILAFLPNLETSEDYSFFISVECHSLSCVLSQGLSDCDVPLMVN